MYVDLSSMKNFTKKNCYNVAQTNNKVMHNLLIQIVNNIFTFICNKVLATHKTYRRIDYKVFKYQEGLYYTMELSSFIN